MFQFRYSFFLLLLSIMTVRCHPVIEIQNPYSRTDWKKHLQHKANLHTHTTRSDGGGSPQTVVDRYKQLGYTILAITDHNEMTYPWTEFAGMEASSGSKQKLTTGKIEPESLLYESRDPVKEGMVDIQGSEISSPHHLGCYFTGYSRRANGEDTVIQAIARQKGLVVFNHPGRYHHPASWYADYLQKYNHIIGIEVINQDNRYPNDRRLWDSVLVMTMPERPVWAFSNDDLHGLKSIGHSWNTFLIPEVTREAVREGMEKGTFFFVFSPSGHTNIALPEIHSVKAKNRKQEIRVEASGQDSVHWISAGKVVCKDLTLILKNRPDIDDYVRAEFFGPGGLIMGTQPFGIVKNEQGKR